MAKPSIFSRLRLVARPGRRLRAAMTVPIAGADGIQSCLLLNDPVNIAPRYGHGKPPHAALASLLAMNREQMIARLDRISAHSSSLSRIAASVEVCQQPATDPFWSNWFLPPLDAAMLYSLVADMSPARFIEVGSGNSTKFVRRAINDHKLMTRIISIDPKPRAEIDGICDEVHRIGAEALDAEFYLSRIRPGDIFFIDGSHYVLPNSDVVALFLDVLPQLPAGVMIHVHDVAWPFDYGQYHRSLFYNEQYLLAAYLLAPGSCARPAFASTYVRSDPELSAKTKNLLAEIGVPPEYRDAAGSSFWFHWDSSSPG